MSRQKLIKVILWSLAVSAASGLLAVFLTNRDLALRLTAMGFVTAAASGLMIPFSMMVDRAKTRAAGLLGMTLCAAEFLLAVGLIWSELGWSNLEEDLALTMVVLALTGLPTVGLFAMASHPLGRVAGWVGSMIAAVCALLFLVGIWYRSSGDTWLRDRLIESGFSLSGSGVLAVLCLAGAGIPEDRRVWRWLGVAAAVLSLVMLLYGIWIYSSSDTRALVCVFSVSSVVAYANLAVMLPLTAGQMWLRYSAVAAAGVTALFIDLNEVVAPAISEAYRLERFATGAGIIAGSGTLALLVLGRLNRRPDYEGGEDGPPRSITVVCPRCRKKQTLPVGEARCGGCKLRIYTRIELPLCPVCGYDTSTLAGGRCPECGTTIDTGTDEAPGVPKAPGPASAG